MIRKVQFLSQISTTSSLNMQEISALIPEFYYDLIARIIPGGCAYFFFTYPWYRNSYTPTTASEIFAAVGICYIVGLIVDLCGDGLTSLGERRSIIHQSLDYFSDPEIAADSDIAPLYSRFLKMCAELVMLRSLMIITLILFLISSFSHISRGPAHYMTKLPLYALAAFIVLSLSFKHLGYCTDRRLRSIKNLHRQQKPIAYKESSLH